MEVKPECHDKCRMAEWRQGESRNLELTHDPTTTLNIVLILHNEGRRRRGRSGYNFQCSLHFNFML